MIIVHALAAAAVVFTMGVSVGVSVAKGWRR